METRPQAQLLQASRLHPSQASSLHGLRNAAGEANTFCFSTEMKNNMLQRGQHCRSVPELRQATSIHKQGFDGAMFGPMALSGIQNDAAARKLRTARRSSVSVASAYSTKIRLTHRRDVILRLACACRTPKRRFGVSFS